MRKIRETLCAPKKIFVPLGAPNVSVPGPIGGVPEIITGGGGQSYILFKRMTLLRIINAIYKPKMSVYVQAGLTY